MLTRFRRGVVRRIGPPLLRGLARTWNVEIEGQERWEAVRTSSRPFVLLCWHEALLPVIWHHRGFGISAMISEAVDGEYLAAFVRSIGYQLIRGSSSRGGTRALRDAIRVLREGRPIGLTPDGPRGPRREFKPGAAAAAVLSGALMLTVHASAEPAWRARSWDGTVVPAPFARVRVAYGPIFDPREAREGRGEAIFYGRNALEEAVRLASSPAGDATPTG